MTEQNFLLPKANFTDISQDDINQCFKTLYQLFEKNKMIYNVPYMGTTILQIPFDLMVIQEIIFRVQPDNIIETGTCNGGLTLFFANLMELMQLPGHVYTVDIQMRKGFEDVYKSNPIMKKRVRGIFGRSSTDQEVLEKIKHECQNMQNVVFLDSNHDPEHVKKELDLYTEFVKQDSYLMIHDTYVPELSEVIPGFLKQHPEFINDTSCTPFLFSYMYNGFFKRIK